MIFKKFISNKLTLSKEFIKRMNTVDDVVSNFILSGLNKELEDLKINFIDVGVKNDIVTFLSSDRFKSNTSPFKEKGRSEIKIGRFAKMIAKIQNRNFTDLEIEKFVLNYKSTCIKLDEKFEIVRGQDIKKWYNESNYYNSCGTLGTSCMKDKDQSFFDLYSNNKNIEMLILTKRKRKFPYLTSTKKLIGRALIWKLRDGNILMDRVYTSSQSDENKFIRIAKSNGWMHKYKSHIYMGEKIISNVDDSNSMKFTVILEGKNQYKNFPYLDTFRYMKKDGTMISTHCSVVSNEKNIFLELTTTNGDFRLEKLIPQ